MSRCTCSPNPFKFRQLLACCLLPVSATLPLSLYASPGDLDATFNGTGKLVTTLNVSDWLTGGYPMSVDIVQLANGKLKVAGIGNNAAYSAGIGYQFYQITSSGAVDESSFVRRLSNSRPALSEAGNWTGNYHVGSGVYQLQLNGTATLIAIPLNTYAPVIEQADGKIVIAGTSTDITKGAFLQRYNSTGGVADNTFSGDGLQTLGTGSINGVTAMVELPSGKLAIAGYKTSTLDQFAVMQLNGNGSPDTAFGVSSVAVADVSASADRATGMIVQPADGRLVVVGNSGIARFLPSGDLDTSFDGDGMLPVTFSAQSVALQKDGKLLVAGSYNNDFALARYLSDGQIDTSFGSGGMVTTDINAGSTDTANKVVVQHDGAIVVAGTEMNSGTNLYQMAIVRYVPGPDTDGDGVYDAADIFPLNPAEWLDTDDDGVGNNSDMDDDSDGVPDYIDAEPLNESISTEKILPLNSTYKGGQVREVQSKI